MECYNKKTGTRSQRSEAGERGLLKIDKSHDESKSGDISQKITEKES